MKIDIVETFITFGTQYQENPTHPEGEHPAGMFGNGYAVIEAPSRGAARDIAFTLFGKNWAFDYPTRPSAELYPAGEILRVSVLQVDQLRNIRAAVADTFEKAGADSNDEEIESLQETRDLLASVAGVSTYV